VLGVAVGALGRGTAMHAIAQGIPRSIEKLMREVEDFLRKQREGGTQG
jgi:hypothetical protein